MRRTLPLLVLSLLLLGFPPAANAVTVPQLNTEAALIGLEFPSADPCIVYDVRVDILQFVHPEDPSLLFTSVSVLDLCTGGFLQGISFAGQFDRSDFVVRPGYRGADLNVTVDGFDFVDQTNVPLTFNLHWSKPSGSLLPDGLAAVTGTVTRGSLVIVFDNSMTWNKWGSESFPWAGLWLCRFAAASHPHCLGQA